MSGVGHGDMDTVIKLPSQLVGSIKPATLESWCGALHLAPQLLFSSILNAQLFGLSGLRKPRSMDCPNFSGCIAAISPGVLDLLRSFQVLERLQRSHIDPFNQLSDKAVLWPYIVLSITICFSYISFLLGSKILSRTSNLPSGPRDIPVLGSLLRLREARTDPVKFAGFVKPVPARSDL